MSSLERYFHITSSRSLIFPSHANCCPLQGVRNSFWKQLEQKGIMVVGTSWASTHHKHFTDIFLLNPHRLRDSVHFARLMSWEAGTYFLLVSLQDANPLALNSLLLVIHSFTRQVGFSVWECECKHNTDFCSFRSKGILIEYNVLIYKMRKWNSHFIPISETREGSGIYV